MSTRFATTDPRPLGAVIALALDAAMLAVAALLVSASWSGATALVLAGVVGLVIAPEFGWHYARLAANARARAWVWDAIRRLALTSAGISACWVIIQALSVPVESGIGGLVALIVYAIIIDTLAVGVLTIVCAILVGVPWTRIMRSLGNSSVRTERDPEAYPRS